MLNVNSIRQKFTPLLIFLLVLFLPTQLGKHFFFDFSYINGIRVDYLATKFYLTDLLALLHIILNIKIIFGVLAKYRKYVLIVLAFSVINIILSPQLMVGTYIFTKYLEIVCIGIIFYRAPTNFRRVIFAFVIGALVELFLSISQIKTQSSLQGIFYYLGERYFSVSTPAIAKTALNGVEMLRPYGTFSHPNSLGGFYVLVYTLVLFQKYLKLAKNYSFWSYILLFLSSLLVLFSFSKNAILTWMVVSSFYLFFFTLSSCRFCKVARFLSVGTLGGLFLTSVNNTVSITERLLLLQNGIVLFFQKPLFGYGLGQHLYALSRLPTKSLYLFNQPIHNIFLVALVEWGLLLFGIVGFCLYELVKKNKKSLIFFGVIGLTGLFDHYSITSQQNILFVGVFMGIVFNETNPFKKE